MSLTLVLSCPQIQSSVLTMLPSSPVYHMLQYALHVPQVFHMIWHARAPSKCQQSRRRPISCSCEFVHSPTCLTGAPHVCTWLLFPSSVAVHMLQLFLESINSGPSGVSLPLTRSLLLPLQPLVSSHLPCVAGRPSRLSFLRLDLRRTKQND